MCGNTPHKFSASGADISCRCRRCPEHLYQPGTAQTDPIRTTTATAQADARNNARVASQLLETAFAQARLHRRAGSPLLPVEALCDLLAEQSHALTTWVYGFSPQVCGNTPPPAWRMMSFASIRAIYGHCAAHAHGRWHETGAMAQQSHRRCVPCAATVRRVWRGWRSVARRADGGRGREGRVIYPGKRVFAGVTICIGRMRLSARVLMRIRRTTRAWQTGQGEQHGRRRRADIVIGIVGANIAGASTAEMLRRLGYDGRITLIGAETELPYERPPLSKEYLAGQFDEERLTLRPALSMTSSVSSYGWGNAPPHWTPPRARLPWPPASGIALIALWWPLAPN